MRTRIVIAGSLVCIAYANFLAYAADAPTGQDKEQQQQPVNDKTEVPPLSANQNSCNKKGVEVAEFSVWCRSGELHKCLKGQWVNTRQKCVE